MPKQRSKSKTTSSADASSQGTIPLPFVSTTCEPSAPTLPTPTFSPESTFCMAGRPAPICLLLGRAVASRVNEVVCGENRHASSVNFARVSPCGRTFPAQEPLFAAMESSSSNPHSEPFSETFPRSGMMRSGSLFELPTLERLISESGSSSSRGTEASWNTPTTEDAGRNGSEEWAERWASGETIPTNQQRLRTQIKWPTLSSAKAGSDVTLTCSGDGRDTPNKLGWAVAEETDVAIQHKQAWPTPTSRDWKDGACATANVPVNGLLGRAAVKWPTTRSSQAMNAPTTQEAIDKNRAKSNLEEVMAQAEQVVGAALNPDWVESLVGLPRGWTIPIPATAKHRWKCSACHKATNRRQKQCCPACLVSPVTWIDTTSPPTAGPLVQAKRSTRGKPRA